MLTSQSVIDKIEVLETGHIQVRLSTRVFLDGKFIAEVYRRHVLAPGASLLSEHPRVRAVATAVWSL